MPAHRLSDSAFSLTMREGFRRAGRYIYKPYCQGCGACVACRVCVKDFVISKRFKRILRHNQDLSLFVEAPRATSTLFRLFSDYMSARHGNGPMAGMDHREFRDFVENGVAATRLYVWRNKQGAILAAMIVDHLEDGFSAVYSFFDPFVDSKRSLGTFMIVSLIGLLGKKHLAYLYLGYYIAQSPKMQYKADFQPLELFEGGEWLPFSQGVQQTE